MTDIPADVIEAAHRLSSCTDPDILLDEITRILADRAAQAERMARLEAAARDVVWFDWSDNDDDAVAAIERLRAALGGNADA